MPRSARDIFDDHVAVLTRELGVRLEQLSGGQRRRLLDEARDRRLNEHEAALTVAYGCLDQSLENDLERARVLVDRLDLIGRQWREQALVDGALADALARGARDRLRRQG